MPVTVAALRQTQQLSGPATVDFGFPSGGEGDSATVTVTGQTWVTAGSIISASAAAIATPDHDGDDAMVEGLTCYVGNIVAGVGFDIFCNAALGSWGRYAIQWQGVV